MSGGEFEFQKISAMTMDDDGGSPAAWTYLKAALENG